MLILYLENQDKEKRDSIEDLHDPSAKGTIIPNFLEMKYQYEI